jgi:hypothetical protein
VFEILEGHTDEVMAVKIQTRADFEEGLFHYHSRQFHEAITSFNRVLAIDAEDKAALLYVQRSKNYLEYGVPVDWEGIEALSEK